MMKPTTTAEIAAMSTLAAPTSLPTLAKGCMLGLAKSTTTSSAVFRNSAVQTTAIVKIKIAQSRRGNFNHNAKMSVNIVAMACIQAFFCVLITCHQPIRAFLKLLILDLINCNGKLFPPKQSSYLRF